MGLWIFDRRFLLVFVLLAGCAKKSERERPVLLPTQPPPIEIEVEPEVVAEPVEIAKESLVMVLLPDAGEDNQEIIADVQDGALFAYGDLAEERQRLIFAYESDPFAVLTEEPRGRSSDWPIHSYSDIVAVVGPYGSKAAGRFKEDKPYGVLSFVLSNDSLLADPFNYVSGLTPEQEASFSSRYIPWQVAQPALDFRDVLVRLGFGPLPEEEPFDENVNASQALPLDEAGNDSLALENEPERVLPVLVLGRADDLFFSRYVEAMEQTLQSLVAPPFALVPEDGAASELSQNDEARVIADVSEGVDLDVASIPPPFVVASLAPDKSTWADTVQEYLSYQDRQQDFQTRLGQIESEALFEVLENQEILEPAPYSAIVMVIHDESDIAWLASLIEFYNNAWRSIPIIGLERWSYYPNLGQEGSLRNALFPQSVRSLPYKEQLDRRFSNTFGRPASRLVRQVYDLVDLSLQIRDNEVSILQDATSVHRGWSTSYFLDARGFIAPRLEMISIGNREPVPQVSYPTLQSISPE